MNNEAETLIVLNGLEGNAATHVMGIQPFLEQHVDRIALVWWIAFFGVLTFLAVSQVAVPLLRRYFKTTV